MATNEAVPYFDRADQITCRATAAITGKRFVHISANMGSDGHARVAHSVGAAGKKAFGVSVSDAASGDDVGVYMPGNIVVPVTAGEALDFGDLVYSDATGQAVDTQPAGALVAGVCLADTAQGADAPIYLV